MVVIEDVRDGFKMLLTSILSSAHGDLYALAAMKTSRGMRQRKKKKKGWGSEHVDHPPSKYFLLTGLE